MKQLEKTYDPQQIEGRIYEKWMQGGYFRAKVNPDKKPYTIVIPPPNITGQLHMGHALDNALQDVLIRWKRMQGYETLWQPGTDHASIATEAKIVEAMRKEGLTKEDLGREKFLERAWEWRAKYGGRIIEQLKKLGSSCDWDRERFTLDEGCSAAVRKVFGMLYDEGLIYRGERIINWCPHCRTSISNAEVNYEEQDGHFWHIRYPLVGGGGYLEVATTRPETLLGDTAVAVNPNDDRYKHLIGQYLVLPLVGRRIPIVADEHAQLDKGTGCVKITPAHDPNDFEVGRRCHLPMEVCLTEDAKITDNYPKYAGMDRYEARKAIVKDLEEGGFLAGIEPLKHEVGTCYRCGTTIEPMVSLQWFVRMEPLAKPAIEAVRDGRIKFVPERFDKNYFHWMENTQDWCISRQLWWGHRIPAYYCDDCGHTVVAPDGCDTCPKCGGHMTQDPDTLDTWFSSALWPFSTLGWPEKTADLEYFYPTNTLVTGYDIITFWVSRMIFSALHYTDNIPFDTVLIHGLVRDSLGRKMSKSLGNGIDPLEVIDKYGADALRLTLLTGNAPGNDMRFYWERVENSRNFANKIWNATRFILMNLGDASVTEPAPEELGAADKWILSRVNDLAQEVTDNMDRFELGVAVQKVFDFIWEEFCDWYIELSKKSLQAREEAPAAANAALWTLKTVLIQALKLLHPFMPFITEEIFDTLQDEEESIMVSAWPVRRDDWCFPEEERALEQIKEAVSKVRVLRNDMNVAPSVRTELFVISADAETRKVFAENEALYRNLIGASSVIVKENDDLGAEGMASAVIPGVVIRIPLAELVDVAKEKERLGKEIERLTGELKRSDGMLSNEKFLARAPQDKVDAEREKRDKYAQMLAQVQEQLAALG